jgi:hypothetical protein
MAGWQIDSLIYSLAHLCLTRRLANVINPRSGNPGWRASCKLPVYRHKSCISGAALAAKGLVFSDLSRGLAKLDNGLVQPCDEQKGAR